MLLSFVCVLGFAARSHAQVRVISPSWLVSQLSGEQGQRGMIDGSTATFGAPFYGEDVVGRLVYGESKGGHLHCTADDYDIPALSSPAAGPNSAEAVRMIDIVVVRRGKCSMVTKTKVALEKGAHAVIVVDREDSVLSSTAIQNIIIGDDGFGANVHIPTILIAKAEGQQLIEAIQRSEVVVELAWNVPTNQVVELDIWMSSGSAESLQFLKDFGPKRRVLNEVMRFTPHYHVFSMPSSDPSVYNGLCSDTSGEFCAEDPDAGGSVTGKEVLEEDVRQLCIHELTKVPVTMPSVVQGDKLRPSVEFAKEYWDYVEQLLGSCPFDAKKEEDRFGALCAARLMKKVKLDGDAVTRCVMHTQTEKLRDQRDHGAWSPRAIRINGWRFNGMLDADLVTRAICAGFAQKPAECDTLLKPRDPFEVYKGIKGQGGVGVKAFVLGLLCIAALVLLALLGYRRAIKRQLAGTVREEVMLEVQAQMAAYNRLHGDTL